MKNVVKKALLLLGLLFAIGGVSQVVVASGEGGLSLYSVVLESPGMDGSGAVHVALKRTDEEIESLVVSAFGKKVSAPKKLLRSIKEKEQISGAQLSYSSGNLSGGNSVYIALTEGASWGTTIVAIIQFRSDGSFRIIENLSRSEADERAEKIAKIYQN